MTSNHNDSPYSDSWCETDLKARKTSEGCFSWKIIGFDAHREEFVGGVGADGVKSREFTVRGPDGQGTKWMLECIPRYGYQNDHVNLNIISRNKFNVKAKIDLSIVDKYGKRVKTNNGRTKTNLHNLHGFADREVFCIEYTNTLKANATTLMPNGDLTFNCALTLIGSYESKSGPQKNSLVPTVPTDSFLRVCENLGEFNFSKELSDVVLECQGQKFEAHQVILAASSPVFRSMFQADMKEKKSQLVEIKDLESDVVSEMLKLIYTGSCVVTKDDPDLDMDMVFGLLKASDKYQMETLKNVCQSLLSSHLKLENSLKFLVLGDMYGAQEMKNAAMEIVINNVNKLMKTEEWRECKKKSPLIIMEVAEAMAMVTS